MLLQRAIGAGPLLKYREVWEGLVSIVVFFEMLEAFFCGYSLSFLDSLSFLFSLEFFLLFLLQVLKARSSVMVELLNMGIFICGGNALSFC